MTQKPLLLDKNRVEKILIIKTSSMGDIIHFFPAICDLVQNLPNLKQIDWIVEENFKTIPRLHHYVDQIIPVAIRRWRKQLISSKTYSEIKHFYEQMNQSSYDILIDAQGLIKSGFITFFNQTAIKVGYDKYSIKESLASHFYTHPMPISKNLHAITRNRLLCAKFFNYENQINLNYNSYEMNLNQFQLYNELKFLDHQRYSLFLHGTSADYKLWAIELWIELGKRLIQEKSSQIILLWSNEKEYQRSLTIQNALGSENCFVPKQILSFAEIAFIMNQTQDIIGVDTGLSHLASAMNKKIVGIYSLTQPELTGIDNAYNLINPSVAQVFEHLLS